MNVIYQATPNKIAEVINLSMDSETHVITRRRTIERYAFAENVTLTAL